MIFNCGDQGMKLNLPEGKWQVLVDGDSSFQWKMNITLDGSWTVASKSALVLGKL
jgi:hypothetical protein